MEILKQPLGNPLSTADQVILLVSAGAGIFSDIPVEDIHRFKKDLLQGILRSSEGDTA